MSLFRQIFRRLTLQLQQGISLNIYAPGRSAYVILILFFLNVGVVEAGCIKGNCINGKGTFKSKDGHLYEGHFKNRKIHGKGHWKSRHGDQYNGDFVNGKIQGKGVMLLSNGESYIGEFVNGKFHGKGKYKWKTGNFYIGNWKDGKQHGEGRYTWKSGTSKMQYYVDGKLKDNDTEDDVPAQNKNVYTFNEANDAPDLDYITNDCTKTYCHEELGIFFYADGSKFTGEFLNGKPHGLGRCQYANGDIYEGGWANHAPHGKGKMIFTTGRRYAAYWDHGYPTHELFEDLDYVSDIKESSGGFNEEVTAYALVVGVATYNHLPSLKYTDDDAYQVYAFLKSPEGGAIPQNNIKVLVDDAATKNNILTAMEQLFSRADENDVVLLYMSGHGLEGSFIPSDFDGYRNQLPYNEIVKIVDQSKARHKLCIADACHSGSLMASRGSNFAPAVNTYYNVLSDLEKGGTALLMSSASHELSLEYSGLRQGVFSHFLMRGLSGSADNDHNKIVTITELYNYIYNSVRKYTQYKQSPILTGSYNREMPVAVIR